MQPEGEVLAHGKGVEQRASLEHHADLAAHLVEHLLIRVDDVDAVDKDAPGVGLEESQDDAQDRALSGSRPAHHHQRLAAVDLQPDAVQDALLAECEVHVFEIDHPVLGVRLAVAPGHGPGGPLRIRMQVRMPDLLPLPTAAEHQPPIYPFAPPFALGRGLRSQCPKISMNSLVMKKSVASTRTEDRTTAWVVDRPTPSVPPEVVSPR